MKTARKKASTIIDLVEDRIAEEHEKIDRSGYKGNTLLHGEAYYELEDEVTEMISGD